jgi:hypothetical protein
LAKPIENISIKQSLFRHCMEVRKIITEDKEGDALESL